MIPSTLFISYSRADMEDVDWLGRLKRYLAPLRRNSIVDAWDDSRIKAGQDWRTEIDNALKRAKAAILLVGPGFLASDFVMTHELPRLLEAAATRQTRIFPLVVGFCAYERSELDIYQAFNDPKRPLEDLPKPEQNKILNALSVAVDEGLRTFQREETCASGKAVELREAIKEIRRLLENTRTAFVAQCRRRDDLVRAVESRLDVRNEMEFEKFFFRYYQQMDEAERFEFDQIRAITEGPLLEGNQSILTILNDNTQLLDKVPALTDLRQHLVFWLNKYERVFVFNRAMCVLYTGVEDAVPFPRGVEDAVSRYLENSNDEDAG